MAEISKLTNVRLLKGVNLTSEYDHTYYFASEAAQSAFFGGKTAINLANYSYQRHSRNSIKVGALCDDLYGCDYMVFTNIAFGNKKFYAFIDDIEYVNNNTSIIHYTIDQVQTWLFETNYSPCFVERCHAAIDSYGLNRVEEDIGYGELVQVSQQDLGDGEQYGYAILLASRIEDDSLSGLIVIFPPGGTRSAYIGCYYGFTTSADTLSKVIQAYIDNGIGDDIIAIYQITKTFTSDGDTFSVPINLDGFYSGLNVQNKKLYSYPYLQIDLYNNQGLVTSYDIDDFNGRNVSFKIKGAYYPSPAACCYPVNYKRLGLNYLHGNNMNSSATVAFSGDSFKAWLAQNRAASATSVVATAGSTAAKIGAGALAGAAAGSAVPIVGNVAGAVIGGAVSILGQVVSVLASGMRAKAAPDSIHGQLGGDAVLMMDHRYVFTAYVSCLRTEYARIIDQFFTRYGYAQKRVMPLNRNARTNWTYIKTLDADVGGNIPNDAAQVINACLNRGITWWNSSFNGDYSQNNPTRG